MGGTYSMELMEDQIDVDVDSTLRWRVRRDVRFEETLVVRLIESGSGPLTEAKISLAQDQLSVGGGFPVGILRPGWRYQIELSRPTWLGFSSKVLAVSPETQVITSKKLRAQEKEDTRVLELVRHAENMVARCRDLEADLADAHDKAEDEKQKAEVFHRALQKANADSAKELADRDRKIKSLESIVVDASGKSSKQEAFLASQNKQLMDRVNELEIALKNALKRSRDEFEGDDQSADGSVGDQEATMPSETAGTKKTKVVSAARKKGGSPRKRIKAEVAVE